MATLAANFKLHKTIAEARAWVGEVASSPYLDRLEVVVYPGFTALHSVAQAIGGRRIGLGAQDVFWEDFGAYTGMVSPGQLRDAGCRHVLVGHSERRRYAHETDEDAGRKLHAAIRAGIRPTYCIGDTEAPGGGRDTAEVLAAQLSTGLRDMEPEEVAQMTFAYEPIWAIGTGQAASPAQALAAAGVIRDTVDRMFGSGAGPAPVLYGGSVTPDNVRDFLHGGGLSGLLVGTASLDAREFLRLITAVAS